MALDRLQPVDKMVEIRKALARIEDMLFCLGEYDGRDVRDIFPEFKTFERKLGNWFAREI